MRTESMQIHQAVETKLKHSEALQQIQQDIDTAIEVQEVLDRILQRAVGLVGARDGSLMLIDERGELHFRARLGGLFPEYKEERGFKLGEGIAGLVAQNCRPYICYDTETDDHFIPIIAGAPIRSLVSVPIISHGAVLGVINVDSPESNRFSNTDAELLVTLANQTAVAIERAELLDGLRQIGEKTLGGAEDLYQYVVEAVHRLTRCPVAMWRVDETGKQARIVAFRGISAGYAQKTVLGLDRSVTGTAIREREIVQVLDIQTDPDFQKKEEAKEEGWQSMLVVPLLAGPERAVGTLSVYSMTKRKEFTRWELNLLRAFAGQAGGAIKSAGLIEELKMLNEIGQGVSSVLDVEAIANLVYEKTSQLMDTTNFFFCLYDKDQEQLHITKWVYNGKDLEPFSCTLSGLTGWVVRQKKPLLIGDWDEEERDFPVKADIVTERQRSWLGVPLVLGEEIIGVLSTQSPDPYAFNLDTQRLLETIASQIAAAIKNARLHADLRCQIERLQTLNQVSRELSTKLDIDSVFGTVVRAVVQTLDCTHCTAFALENSLLVPRAPHSEGGEDVIRITRCFALGEGLAGWAAQENQSILTRDAKKHEHFSKGKTRPDAERSMIVVPVRVEDQVVGVISADQDRANAFDERDLQMVETLALQAEAAILNADLISQERQQAAAMDLVQQISAKISTTLNVEETLALIMEGAMQLTGTDSGVIHLVDEDKQAVIRSYEFPEDFGHPPSRFSKKKGLTWTVVSTGQPVALSDIARDERVTPAMLKKGVKSLIGAPLKVETRTIGALFLNDTEPHVFTDYEKDLLSILAGHAAIAIRNARLYEEERRKAQQLEVLRRIYERIIAVGVEDIDRILDLLYEEASKIIDLSDAQVQIAFYDGAKDEVTFPLAVEQDNGEVIDVVRWSKRESKFSEEGEDEVVKQFKPRERRDPPGLTEYVIRTKQPLLITEDFEQKAADLGIRVWPRFGRLDRPTHSWLGVPMIVQDRVIGIISIQSLEVEHAFDQGHVELLATVANQAAVAIENARLYQQASEQLAELQRAQRRLVTAERLIIMNEVAAEFVHRLGNLAGTIPVRVALAKELLDATDTRDCTILRLLEGIKADTEAVLKMARDLQHSTTRGALEPTNLNELIRAAIALHGIPSNIQVVQDLSPSVPVASLPREQFMETLKNLITNAIDAMPEGGTLTIRTNSKLRNGNQFVELGVTDTGHGISSEDQERIFDLFYTTKPDGSGYGLWRDKNLLEALGGEISVESEPGQVSKFVLLIPAAT